MKSIVLIVTFIAIATAAPQYRQYATQSAYTNVQPQVRFVNARDDSSRAVILRYDSDNIGVGGYSYAVETSDGQIKEEQGQLVNPGSENEAIVVRGQFSYPGPDGLIYSVAYTADENGFHPQGAHLPRVP